LKNIDGTEVAVMSILFLLNIDYHLKRMGSFLWNKLIKDPFILIFFTFGLNPLKFIS
jgi:hypothetical protein